MTRFMLLLLVASTFLPAAFAAELGVNGHLPANNSTDPNPYLDRAVEMRLSWVRMDFRWDIVEPEPMDDVATQGHWEIFDGSVAQARSRGMQILPIIQAPAGWATVGGIEDSPLNPTGQEHYRRYVRALAQRYRGQIDIYEIFNETDLGAAWPDKVNVYVDQLLIPAREEIHAVDPAIRIAGPAAASNMVATVKLEDYLKQLGIRQRQYEAATGQRFYDVITQHVYAETAQGVIDDMKVGRKFCLWIFCIKQRDPIVTIYAKNGFDREPIWLTEFGWISNRTPEDQAKQAALIGETVAKLGQIPRLQLGFIYHLWDDPREASDFGLLFSDASPKQVYYTLRDRP